MSFIHEPEEEETLFIGSITDESGELGKSSAGKKVKKVAKKTKKKLSKKNKTAKKSAKKLETTPVANL